jgi:prevent-host-death family protein
VKDISATEAARKFSEVLDAVEHRHETFVVIRKGRSVARISPAVSASGRAVKDMLLDHRPDAKWGRELRAMRSMLLTEERDWNA